MLALTASQAVGKIVHKTAVVRSGSIQLVPLEEIKVYIQRRREGVGGTLDVQVIRTLAPSTMRSMGEAKARSCAPTWPPPCSNR